MKTHLLRAKDLGRTACGLDVSHKAARADKPLRFWFTRDLASVDCDVCYRSIEAARIFLGNISDFAGSDKPLNEIGVTRDGHVVVKQ